MATAPPQSRSLPVSNFILPPCFPPSLLPSFSLSSSLPSSSFPFISALPLVPYCLPTQIPTSVHPCLDNLAPGNMAESSYCCTVRLALTCPSKDMQQAASTGTGDNVAIVAHCEQPPMCFGKCIERLEASHPSTFPALGGRYGQLTHTLHSLCRRSHNPQILLQPR